MGWVIMLNQTQSVKWLRRCCYWQHWRHKVAYWSRNWQFLEQTQKDNIRTLIFASQTLNVSVIIQPPPLPPARTWRPWPRCCWPTRAPSPRCSWRRYLITDNWRLCGIWEYDRSALLQHPQQPGQHSRKRRNIILLKGANKIKLEYQLKWYPSMPNISGSWR